jgi:nucleoside-diphosphate-sugar epimerase
VLPFVHVDDVGGAYLGAVGQSRTFGQAYNIAGSEALTVTGYVDTIARVMGVTATKCFLTRDMEQALVRPLFFFPYERSQLYSIDKARNDFNFSPGYDIARGMGTAYEWWQANLGVSGTVFLPNKLGFDVDLEFEDSIISRYFPGQHPSPE